VLSTLLLGDCNKPAAVVSLPAGVALSASANAAAGPEATARITAHLADGSAWDDVLVGDIAWHTPAGDVVHTFSYSISQPSRTLNDFVYFGFNEDEGGLHGNNERISVENIRRGVTMMLEITRRVAAN